MNAGAEGKRPPGGSWCWDVRTSRTCCSTGTESASSSHCLITSQNWAVAKCEWKLEVREARRCHPGRLAFQDTEEYGEQIWRGKWKVSSTVIITYVVKTQESFPFLFFPEIHFQCWIPVSTLNDLYLKVSSDSMLPIFHRSCLVFKQLWLLESSLYSDKIFTELSPASFFLFPQDDQKSTFILLFWSGNIWK